MSLLNKILDKKRTVNKEPERLNVELTQTFKVVETNIQNVQKSVKNDEKSVKNDVFSLKTEQKSVKNNANFNVISADEINFSKKSIKFDVKNDEKSADFELKSVKNDVISAKNDKISTEKKIINIFDGIIKGNNWFEIHYGDGKIFYANHSTKENFEEKYRRLNKHHKGAIPKEIKPIIFDVSSYMITYI